MGTTSTYMGLSIPTLGGDPGTWDSEINASLAILDVHDHTSGRGVAIPTAGIALNADLTFAGYAATNLKAAAFTAQSAYTTNKSLWVNSSNDDLYYRRAGTDNRLTVNGVLNVSIVGGIIGDYSAAAAAVYYDDGAGAYRFLEAAPAPNSWSYVKAGGFDLYEHASGIANHVQLRSPAALAASYVQTYPAALPGSTLIQQVSSAGQISWSNTISQAVVMQSGLQITGGAADFDASSSISLPARTVFFAATDYMYQASGTSTKNLTAVTMTSAGVFYFRVPFHIGDRITDITVTWTRNGATNADFELLKVVFYAGAATSLVKKTIAAGAGNLTTQVGSSPTSGSLPQTLATGSAYYISISLANTDTIEGFSVTYDRP